MKKLFLFLIFALVSFSFSFSFAVDLKEFATALSSKREKVAEFKLIQTEANKLGIKHVYLFGTTATSWARYVKEGFDSIKAFDYEYESIFRPDQEINIVIDGTVQDAERLQGKIRAFAPHLIGDSKSKAVWKVRLLNEKNGDKEPLLSEDFQNQHLDSYSTGLIDLMECESFDCIKDAKYFDAKVSPFLNDVFHNEISFYYSPNHFQTKRYLDGLNPEIIAAINYYTNVVQYDAKRKKSDILILQKIIDDFNVSVVNNSKPYVKEWIEANAKKLMTNAINMPFAEELITETKLKEKIIALGHKDEAFTSAWYLNKSSLPLKPLATSGGATLRDLLGGELIVTHNTKTLADYHSLTKGKFGYINAWKSRHNVSEEYPRDKREGFYVLIKDKKNWDRNTGITISMKPNLDARQGQDFDFVVGREDELVFYTGTALEVIPESLPHLGLSELLNLLTDQNSIYKDNPAMQERIGKIISDKLANPANAQQKAEIVKSINDNFKRASGLLDGLVDLDLIKVSLNIPVIYQDKSFYESLFVFINEYLIKKDHARTENVCSFFIKYLSLNYEDAFFLINDYIDLSRSPYDAIDIVRYLFRDDNITSHKGFPIWIETYIKRANEMANEKLITYGILDSRTKVLLGFKEDTDPYKVVSRIRDRETKHIGYSNHYYRNLPPKQNSKAVIKFSEFISAVEKNCNKFFSYINIFKKI